ncbi:DUF6449 domain-containing protein [Bacillus sp. AK128]
MQSKTSWFNKEIILQGFRSTGWLGIIYFLGLFFALPLRMIMYVSEEDNIYRHQFFQKNNLFTWNNEFLTILSAVVPVLIGVFIFRYIQTKASSDLFHSLPLTRVQLYKHFVGIGAFLVVLPILLNTLILLMIHPTFNLSSYFTVNDILYWAGVTITLNLLAFIGTVLIGMITGISIIHGVLSYIFLFLPIGLALLLSFSLDIFLFGFTPEPYTGPSLGKLSPLSRTVMINGSPLTWIELGIYIGLIVALFVFAIFIYKRRRLEAISNPIVFPILRPIFKYGVTFCFMLFGGLYFGEVQNSFGWTVFGYVVGSIIGYLLAEMILQKTWRVLGGFKGYLYYIVGIAIIFLCIHFDVFGYEGRVPEVAEIERIYYGNESYFYLDKDMEIPIEYFHEEENFENIIKLHEAIISDKDKLKDQTIPSHPESVFIAYELKNGDRLIRDYMVPASAYAQLLKPIYESQEYKEVNFRAMQLEAPEIEKIYLSPSGIGFKEREVIISDQAEVAELLSKLKEDILLQEYENYTEHNISGISFDLVTEHPHYEIYHGLTTSYPTVEKWLKDKGLYEQAVLTGEDFEYAILLEDEMIDINEYYSLSNDAMIEKVNSLENTTKITNPKELLELWKESDGDISKGINVAFKFKEQPYMEFRRIDE